MRGLRWEIGNHLFEATCGQVDQLRASPQFQSREMLETMSRPCDRLLPLVTETCRPDRHRGALGAAWLLLWTHSKCTAPQFVVADLRIHRDALAAGGQMPPEHLKTARTGHSAIAATVAQRCIGR